MEDKEILLIESSILAQESTNTFIIKLFDVDMKRNICLTASTELMFAAGVEMFGMELPIVFAHDVMINIVKELGGVLLKVVIYDLVEGKFHARLHIGSADAEEKTVEMAVADALALAYKAEIPLYACESVFEKDRNERQGVIHWWDLDEEFILGILHQVDDEQLKECSVEDLNKFLEKVVESEDYALATRLREIIKRKEK